MYLNPILLRRNQISMAGRRKKVHGREIYDHVLAKHKLNFKEICCGFRFSKKELNTDIIQKFQCVTGKEGVLRDMVSSSVYLLASLYAVFLLIIFYVLYDEMAVKALYGIHQVQLTTYLWFSLVMMSVINLLDYLTTKVTEYNDPTRNRLKHLHRLAPHGYLWQRDLFTSQVDLRIDDSLRSLDTLNFTVQYYYGCLLLSM